MNQQNTIKEKFERNEKVLSLKPKMGLGRKISKTKLINGLCCEISEGSWTIKSDMPEQVGGNGSAPTPGVFGRAALGACLASGYVLWASKLDITIDSLEITVEADYDDCCMFGISDEPAGYLEVRYHVKIESPNAPEEVEAFLNKAEKHSPYLDVFSRAQKCKRVLEII